MGSGQWRDNAYDVGQRCLCHVYCNGRHAARRWSYGEGRGSVRLKVKDNREAAQPTSDLWHQRLAHVNDKVLQKLVSSDVSSVDMKVVEPWSFCEGCMQGKATKHKPKPLGEIRSTRRLERVHSDVCGPMQTASSSGKKYMYMVTFVDDFSRSCATYFMAHKSDTFAMFQEFHAKVTGESGE